MEQLKMMKEQLISIVQGQLSHPDTVDTKELGEAVDMIKDLAEASYYCAITKAMEEGQESEQDKYYTNYNDYNRGKMYYGGSQTPSYYGSRSNPVYYTPREYEYNPIPMMSQDPREGRSRLSRRMYMESKEMHKDMNTQIQELEKYIRDLGDDITEMIANATPEEKEILRQKIATLSNKIK